MLDIEKLYFDLYAHQCGDDEDDAMTKAEGMSYALNAVELAAHVTDDEAVMAVFTFVFETARMGDYGIYEDRGIVYLGFDDEPPYFDDDGMPLGHTLYYDTQKKEFFSGGWDEASQSFYPKEAAHLFAAFLKED